MYAVRSTYSTSGAAFWFLGTLISLMPCWASSYVFFLDTGAAVVFAGALRVADRWRPDFWVPERWTVDMATGGAEPKTGE